MSSSSSSSSEEVKCILAINVPKEVNKRYYNLLWENGDTTWEPEENLTGCEKLLDEFFRDVPEAIEIYNKSVIEEAAKNGTIPKLRTVIKKNKKSSSRTQSRNIKSTETPKKNKEKTPTRKISKIINSLLDIQSDDSINTNISNKTKEQVNEPPQQKYPINSFDSDDDSNETIESSRSKTDTNNFKGTFEDYTSSSSGSPEILSIYSSPIKENETNNEKIKKSEAESEVDNQKTTYKFDTESESEIDQDMIFNSGSSGSLKKDELFKVNWENCFPNLDKFYDNDKSLNDYAHIKSNPASFQVLSVSSIDKIFGEDSYVVSIKLADVPQEMTIPLDIARHICPDKIIDHLVASI